MKPNLLIVFLLCCVVVLALASCGEGQPALETDDPSIVPCSVEVTVDSWDDETKVSTMVKALYKNDTGKIVSRVTFNILGKDGSVINNFSEPASLDPGEADTFKSRIQHSRFPSSTKLWEEPYAQEKKKYADVSKCQIVNIETEN